MNTLRRRLHLPLRVAGLLAFLFATLPLSAQKIDTGLYSMLRWRMIGPHRGGRTVGATGVVQQPNTFYMGVNNGGVWKTNDFGRTWNPIFDEQPTGSIGDVSVAQSNPNVVYAVSGEGLQRPDLSVGNGVYHSTDAGKTWVNTGLSEARQIGGVAIDPKNEKTVFVAALGHPYGPNKERGIYRTTDGAKTWKQVLYIDENTGAIQVTIDPGNHKIIYADMWAGRLAPWENGMWQGKESGLFKSVDGGDTWKKLTKGLPNTADDGLGRIGFCISPSNSNRLYACVDATKRGGFYISDDGGESWTLRNEDRRLWDRGTDFAECKVDPKNPDIVYAANVVTWKSVDGGKTFSAFRGAPGGDDYHRLWINPDNPDIILLAGDQGAIITVNGGQTWSSWYNQPTAQFYHVSADNDFPYNVYSGQQESGSVCISSRGHDGQITFREWFPVGAEEYGYVVADPKDPNIVFGGKLSRFNKRTGQTQHISPEALRSSKYRFLRTAPLVFSAFDNKTLYYAGNVIFKTSDGGNSWKTVSPDLTRPSYDVPECIGIFREENMKTMPQRGVIYTVAPSNKTLNTIWAGTDDGLMHITRDGGKTWKDITPPDMSSWCKVSLMDAGHFDDKTCYAAVNRIRLDDMHPCIYRTHDGGASWQKIVNGLPNDPINVVREDPICKGLLFAGSERMVYVSFDDGDNWQPLRLNMPCTSIRDLVIKDNDLVIGTHGRSFWILDNMNPLRDIAGSKNKSGTRLYFTSTSWRVRWNMNTDTPLPQEEPGGENPPDGATIDYYLAENVSEVRMEILDKAGELVRRYSSADKPYVKPLVNIPDYWIRPQSFLSTAKGAHRFVWDLHWPSVDAPSGYGMNAIYQNTAPDQVAPWVIPGVYTVKLTVEGKSYTQPLTIKMDPRVKTSAMELKKQYALSMVCYLRLHFIKDRMHRLESVVSIAENMLKDPLRKNEELRSNVENAKSLMNGTVGSKAESLKSCKGKLEALLGLLQGCDMPVTTQVEAAVHETESSVTKLFFQAAYLSAKIEWAIMH